MTITINGADCALPDDPRVSLLDLLRERLHLPGTKKGCNQGACGACTVLVDGERIIACLALAVQYQARDIVTVEGLADGDTQAEIPYAARRDEIGAMSATADSAKMTARGIDDRRFSRANDRRRGGFVESAGGGTILLARGGASVGVGMGQVNRVDSCRLAVERAQLLVQGVGQAVGHNPISVIVPCHRVVGSGGSLVGFAGGLDRKRWLLAHEESETTRESRLF